MRFGFDAVKTTFELTANRLKLNVETVLIFAIDRSY